MQIEKNFGTLDTMEHKIDFAKIEEGVLENWTREGAFERSNELAKDRPEYVFYDGPPFATGLPHYGHILSGTIKDTFTRFYYMQGMKVERRFGWDCHGLPVEYEIDKILGIKSTQDVMKMGIRSYNEECKKIVLRYSREWETTVKRMGRWIDFENGYRTMDLDFMDSVWNIFRMLYDRGSVYQGYRVMPYSTECTTPVSNFEANQNYKEVSDPSILVAFPLRAQLRGHNLSLVAWTTTPWTLTANLGLLVNKSFVYVIFRLQESLYVMHRDRLSAYFADAQIVEEISAEEMLGLEYDQPLPYFESYRQEGFFRVLHADFVSESDGTGIVHCAPGFGEEDYNAILSAGLVQENGLLPCPLDEKGRFTAEVVDYKGIYFKDVDKMVIKSLKEKILLSARVNHRYPFCWRSDTPLVYKLVSNWFVKVKKEAAQLLKTNELINWVPSGIGERKFKNWLAQARDWSVSRNRFWGTPIPLWHSNGKYICVGSVAELRDLTGKEINDIHREYIDDLVIVKDGEEYRRVEEVLDCWFESGSMPYAQQHWPSSGNLKHPADFISEGVDQTRGWFYTLHVISTVLFDKPAFRNCVVSGIVLASDGKKMSKRLKNYADPTEVVDRYGADSLRMYLISSPVVAGENMNFAESGVSEVLKTLLIPWYNCVHFWSECAKGSGCVEMDSWILNSFNTCGLRVESDLKNYLLTGVLTHAASFINDLSNWYIRMNRKALKAGASDVLRSLLVKFAVVMAPFTPFFSEYVYQRMAEKREGEFWSVHYEMFPRLQVAASHGFDEAKKVIEAIRKMRETKGISLKTPLQQAKVVCSKKMQDIVGAYSHVIKGECFLFDLAFVNENSVEFTTSFRPNFSEIRKSGDKQEIRAKISLINETPEAELARLVEGSLTLEKNGVAVHKDEVLYKKEFICSGYSMSFGDFSVVLDTEMTSQLDEAKTAREFFSFVQRLRKKSGFVEGDPVVVYVSSPSIAECVAKHYDVKFCEKRENTKARDILKHQGADVEVCLYTDTPESK